MLWFLTLFVTIKMEQIITWPETHTTAFILHLKSTYINFA